MEDKNILIVRECLEQIINFKHFDRLYDYFSEGCIIYNTPYVGMGIRYDDSSGERFLVNQVAPHAPASGKLFKGDEILTVRDGNKTWQGFEQLSEGMWGFGAIGTIITITLQREGQNQEVTIQRGLVQDFDMTVADYAGDWQRILTRDTPDQNVEIDRIIAAGDQVAYYATNTATHTKHKRSAVWSECNIMRLEGGKIVGWWGVEDALSTYRQFGFRLVDPGKA
jgi:predicted SnoaL-like aldol condensation-catalyzing enzyme